MNPAEIRKAVSEFIDAEFDPELSLIVWRTRLLDGDGPPRYGLPIGSAEDSIKNKHQWLVRCFVNEVSFRRLRLVREDWLQRPYWLMGATIKRDATCDRS